MTYVITLVSYKCDTWRLKKNIYGKNVLYSRVLTIVFFLLIVYKFPVLKLVQ